MIDWAAFLLVFGVTLVASLAIILVVGLGIRLLSTPSGVRAPAPGAEPADPDAEEDDVNRNGRPAAATLLAWVCFTAFGAIVLYGLWLIIPAFH